MKAFVTGGTGFIGTHLVEALVSQAHKITCLVRSPQKAERLRRLGTRMVPGDLQSPQALRAGIRGADVVFHVAGVIAARSAEEFYLANREGTRSVIEACVANGGVRLVFVSSLAAAGPTRRGRPLDEAAAPHPVTIYGKSKLAAERLVQESRVPWTIVRPPVVYGPHDLELLRLFRLTNRRLGAVFGDGKQELSLIYAADLAEGLVAVGASPATTGRVYYATYPRPTTTRGLVQAIGQALGKRPIVLRIPVPLGRGVLAVTGAVARLARRATVLSLDKAPEYFAPAWTCRGDALERDTGFRARTTLEDGLQRTVDWYRSEGWL